MPGELPMHLSGLPLPLELLDEGCLAHGLRCLLFGSEKHFFDTIEIDKAPIGGLVDAHG